MMNRELLTDIATGVLLFVAGYVLLVGLMLL